MLMIPNSVTSRCPISKSSKLKSSRGDPELPRMASRPTVTHASQKPYTRNPRQNVVEYETQPSECISTSETHLPLGRR